MPSILGPKLWFLKACEKKNVKYDQCVSEDDTSRNGGEYCNVNVITVYSKLVTEEIA